MSKQQQSATVPAQGHSLDEEVAAEFGRIKEMMLTAHYFAEASWLVAAAEYPQLCGSPQAQRGLREAAKIAWLWGAPKVALWLNTDVLNNGGRLSLSWSDEFPPIQDPTLVPAFETRQR